MSEFKSTLAEISAFSHSKDRREWCMTERIPECVILICWTILDYTSNLIKRVGIEVFQMILKFSFFVVNKPGVILLKYFFEK